MAGRAQITLEAILIIAFFILILVAVSIPMGFKSSQAARDTTRVLEMRNNLDKIASAIEAVQTLGPGAVRTVRISSNVKSWAIATGDPVMHASISYWVEWEKKERVPAELAFSDSLFNSNPFGGLGRNITNISADTFEYVYINEKGSFEVRVENNNNLGESARLHISRAGSTINITIAP